MEQLLIDLVDKVARNLPYIHRHEFSAKRNARKSYELLIYIKELIDENIELHYNKKEGEE